MVGALQGSTWRVGENHLTGCGREPGFLGIYIDFRLDRDPFINSDWESDHFPLGIQFILQINRVDPTSKRGPGVKLPVCEVHDLSHW